MAGTYGYIEDGFFSDPDYKTPAEKLIGVYLFVHGDMSGVTPWEPRLISIKTGAAEKTVRRVRQRLAARHKVLVSRSGDHVWLASGIYYRLHKGRFSDLQMQAVVDKLRFWHAKGCFDYEAAVRWWTERGQGSDTSGTGSGRSAGKFLFEVGQLYATKYDIKIPIPSELISTELTEDVETKMQCGNVEKLSTAGRRLWLRLYLGPFRDKVGELTNLSWIDEAIEDFKFDRVALAIDTLNMKPARKRGRSLPNAIRAHCQAQK